MEVNKLPLSEYFGEGFELLSIYLFFYVSSGKNNTKQMPSY